MRCPQCNGFITRVIDSRPVDDTTKRRRRYECLHCEDEVRFSTIEIPIEEYEQMWNRANKKDERVWELTLVIEWLIKSIFSERMNNNYLLLKKYVSNPSQEMVKRLQKFGIDITSYQ